MIRLTPSAAAIAAVLTLWPLSLWLYGANQWREGRAVLAGEIAAAAAEKRAADAETLAEFRELVDETRDDDLWRLIIDNGWVQPTD